MECFGSFRVISSRISSVLGCFLFFFYKESSDGESSLQLHLKFNDFQCTNYDMTRNLCLWDPRAPLHHFHIVPKGKSIAWLNVNLRLLVYSTSKNSSWHLRFSIFGSFDNMTDAQSWVVHWWESQKSGKHGIPCDLYDTTWVQHWSHCRGQTECRAKRG